MTYALTHYLHRKQRAANADSGFALQFSVPEAGRNFLAYSLNESIDEDNLRVYIALLFNEGGNYCLGALDSEEDGQLAMRVFGQILREAATGERRESDVPYHLLDLNKQQLPAAAAATIDS